MEFTLNEKAQSLPQETRDFLAKKAVEGVDLAPFDVICDNKYENTALKIVDNCKSTAVYTLIVDGKKVGDFCSDCAGIKAKGETQRLFNKLCAETVSVQKVPPDPAAVAAKILKDKEEAERKAKEGK